MITIFLFFQLAASSGNIIEVDAFMTRGECDNARHEAAAYYEAAKIAKPDYLPPIMMECLEATMEAPTEARERS